MVPRITDGLIIWGFTLFTFLLPLFFLPTTADVYDFNKQILLYATTTIILIAWVINSIAQKTFRLVLTPFTLPFGILTSAFIASTTIESPPQLEAWLKTGTLIALWLLMTIVTSHISNLTTIRRLLLSLTAAAILLSLLTIVNFLKPHPYLNPTGSPLALITYLVPLALVGLYQTFLVKITPIPKILWAFSTSFMITAIIITFSALFPTDPATAGLVLLPYSTSLKIVINALQSFPQNLLGVGPDSFLTAFSEARPLEFNLTSTWNLRFTSATNEPLSLLTTTGILGLAAWVFLGFQMVRYSSTARTPLHLSLTIATLASFLIQLFLPANYLLLLSYYLLLILLGSFLKVTHHPRVRELTFSSSLLSWLFGVPLIIAITIIQFLNFTHVYAAEVAFKKSLDSLRQNKGTDTYNFQLEAITKNPYSPRYRRAYSITNLSLANTLATSKRDLSTLERENVAQLFHQAIREAKTATQLKPHDPTNWETLATVYKNLINIAADADEWAITTYTQALRLDPANPRLFFELGSIYYATGRYQEAIQSFQQAITLKPDWANAFYNLAAAYKADNDYQNALVNLQAVLNLVNPSSADYQKTQDEINQLKLPSPSLTPPSPASPSSSTTLQTPPPLPSPNTRLGNFTLPQSASPGASQPSF